MSDRLPHGWQVRRLAELARVNPEQLDEGTDPDLAIDYIDLTSVERSGDCPDTVRLSFGDAPSRARRRTRPGDILVSTVRPYLRGFTRVPDCLADRCLVASTGYAVIRPADPRNGEFLYQHVLAQGFVDYLKPLMTGSNYPAVNASDVAGYPMAVPPECERWRIAVILAAVDGAIAAARAVIDQTRRLRTALLQALLTHGLPGRSGRARTSRWWTTLPAEWRESELGGLIVDSPQNGLYVPESDYGDGYPILRINDFSDGEQLVRSPTRRVRITEPEAQRYFLSPADIIVNRVNSIDTLGKSAVVACLTESVVYESNMMRFRVDAQVARPHFVSILLTCPGVKRQFQARAKKAVAQASIDQRDLASVVVPLPPAEEQDAIVEIVRAVETRSRVSEAAIAQLEQTKSALCQALLTGRIRAVWNRGSTNQESGRRN